MLERFLKYSYIIMICFLIGEECSKFIFNLNIDTITMNILRISVYLTLLCFMIDKSNLTVYSIINDDNEIEGTFPSYIEAVEFLNMLEEDFPFPERKIIQHTLYNNNDWKEMIMSGDFYSNKNQQNNKPNVLKKGDDE